MAEDLTITLKMGVKVKYMHSDIESKADRNIRDLG